MRFGQTDSQFKIEILGIVKMAENIVLVQL